MDIWLLNILGCIHLELGPKQFLPDLLQTKVRSIYCQTPFSHFNVGFFTFMVTNVLWYSILFMFPSIGYGSSFNWQRSKFFRMNGPQLILFLWHISFIVEAVILNFLALHYNSEADCILVFASNLAISSWQRMTWLSYNSLVRCECSNGFVQQYHHAGALTEHP